jgi:uncharacterized protein (TIGR02646 family)
MHTVTRGPEPGGLGAVRDEYTPRWVQHYREGTGSKPSDSKWCEFHTDVSNVFFGICGYCERECKGEVDHFRPKSRFPERVYEWKNWVLACHACNNMKGGKWPVGGYVDPCAKSRNARPEAYFDFDTTTGEILPTANLSAARRRKAEQMIADLRLNAYHRLKERVQRLRVVSGALDDRHANDPRARRFVKLVASRKARLSTITRTWLKEQGYTDESN